MNTPQASVGEPRTPLLLKALVSALDIGLALAVADMIVAIWRLPYSDFGVPVVWHNWPTLAELTLNLFSLMCLCILMCGLLQWNERLRVPAYALGTTGWLILPWLNFWPGSPSSVASQLAQQQTGPQSAVLGLLVLAGILTTHLLALQRASCERQWRLQRHQT